MKEIGSLSDTCWASRYKTSQADNDCNEGIENALIEIKNSASKQSFEANGLLITFRFNKFIILLKVFTKLLNIIHVLHKTLQLEDSNLGFASDQIIATIKMLKSLRNNLEWNNLWDSFKDWLTDYNKRIPFANIQNDFVYDEHIPNRVPNNPNSDFYNELYFPILDNLIV